MGIIFKLVHISKFNTGQLHRKRHTKTATTGFWSFLPTTAVKQRIVPRGWHISHQQNLVLREDLRK